MLQWLAEHWDQVAYAVGLLLAALVSGKAGERRGERRAFTRPLEFVERPTPRERPSRDQGAAALLLLVVLALLLGGTQMGCSSSSWASGVRKTITVAHASGRRAMEVGMPRYNARCDTITDSCVKAADTTCKELEVCHQTGDAIVTAYAGANGAMAMAMLTVAAIETIEQEIEGARGKERVALETERDQLMTVAKKQIRNAQRQARRVVDELRRVGAL